MAALVQCLRAPACLTAWLPACLRACILDCLLSELPGCLPAGLDTCLPAACLPACFTVCFVDIKRFEAERLSEENVRRCFWQTSFGWSSSGSESGGSARICCVGAALPTSHFLVYYRTGAPHPWAIIPWGRRRLSAEKVRGAALPTYLIACVCVPACLLHCLRAAAIPANLPALLSAGLTCLPACLPDSQAA